MSVLRAERPPWSTEASPSASPRTPALRWSSRAWAASSARWSPSPTSTCGSAPGERRAILGSNGAGKTTLFNAVTGDFPPSSGRIRFFGEDVTTFPVHERIRRGSSPDLSDQPALHGTDGPRQPLRRLPGRVAQAALPVAPARRDATMAQARMIAHSVHLDDLLERPVAILSHGQQRQLEIALALTGRRGLFCSTSRRRACRRRSGATWSPSSTPCRSISATSSSSTISTSRCASPRT